MNLQTELIKEFAEVVHDVSGNKQRLSDNIVYGTLSKEGAHNYVKIDGSDLLTPVVVAASADSGDRVGVIIKNHTAIAGFNFSSPSVNTRTMENLVSTVNGKFDRIDATYITAEKANLTFATIQSLEAVDGKFDNLDTKFLTVESAKLQYATVEKLNATDAKVGSISGDFANFKNGEFSTLKAKQASFESATTENFKATNAKVDNLESTSLKASEAEIKYATIESLNATNAKVKNLDATTLKAADAKLTYATIESLNALKGDITDLNVGNLTARVATIEGAYISKTETKQLLAGYADIKLANVAAGAIGSALIGDGAITDAKIASVSANKLTAGTIDASKINVTNINADNLTVGTINGQRIGDKSIDLTKLSKEVPTKEYLDSVQNGLQNQIDSAIQTYTSDTIPTLENAPASSWTDNSTKAKHVGDICYVTNAGGDADGYCYRFTNTGTSAAPVYEWLLIKDSDVNRALQELVTVNGDISGLKTFQSETSSWRTSTDTEISSVKTRTTTIETTYSTKEETKTAADSAKSSAIESAKVYTDSAKTSAIESAKGYTDTAKTDAIASSKTYTDTATKDMATSTAVANAKKEAISEAAKDASSKASAAQSTAISEAAKDATNKADAAKSSAISAAASDATKKADAAKSSAISAAATDATTKANTAKSEAISTAASDATKKANDAKSAAISAASSDATTKANTAKSEAISVAATDATTKANAALNSAKGYADDAVAGVTVGGRNLLTDSKLTSGLPPRKNWEQDYINDVTGFSWTSDGIRFTTGSNGIANSNGISIKTMRDTFGFKVGDTLTFSADVKGTVGTGIALMQYWSSTKNNPDFWDRRVFGDSIMGKVKKDSYTRFSVTVTLEELYPEQRGDYFCIGGGYNADLYFKNIKLERGNKATDWTPAPEDIEEAINTKVSTTVFNEVKQTVDANSATITRLSETVTTKADGSSVTALSNTVNSIKQTADSNTAAISGLQTTVSKKADSSTVETVSKTLNTVKQTADSNSANISELSKTVSTKADGSTVTALTTRMSNAEQNLDGFKTTVSKTYVTSQTYNEKVTNLESGISAAQGTANTAKSTADSATTTANTAKSTADTASNTASVAKSTAEGAVSTANTAKNTADGAVSTANSAKTTADAAKSSVDNLEIGGRNLFRKTDTPQSNNDYLTAQYNYASEPLVAGETYTVTICVTPAENVSAFQLYLSQGYIVQANLYVSGTKKQIISKTFVASYCSGREPSVNSNNGVAQFYRLPNNGTVTGNSTIHWVKIEKGNKPTDWTPAPEDAIDHQYTQYYRSTSTTTPTGGTWQDTVPDLLENTCIWIRQAIVHVGGDIEYSDPVLDSVTKKVVSMSAEVTKTAEGLTSTANKVTTLTNDLAGVSTRLGTAESKISQNADSISAKVSTTDFNTFKSSNTTAINDAKSSAISTAASDATTKANNALSSAKTYSDGQIETVNAAITQTNTEISAMKGQIALKVEQTDINKAVDGIEIGGRNLLKHTDIDKYGTGPWIKNGDAVTMEVSSEVTYLGKKTIKIVGSNGILITDSEDILIKTNTKYVYSIMMYSLINLPVSASNPMHVWTLNGDSSMHHESVHKFYPSVIPKNTWTRVYVVLSVKSNLSEYYHLRPFLYGIGDSGVYVCEPKVEEGTMPTPWTPAPEDTEERLSSLESWKSEASLKITKDGIIGTVGSYYATGADVTALTGRVTQAESTIKQQSDSIALTVKKDSVISAINQTSESVKISANKISLTAAGLVEIINSGDTKIKAANLNLSATDVVNIINSGTTKIEASKLNLSGYVTVSDLSGSGTTTIDGSNIKTGKISTDRLDVNDIFAKDVTATGTITGATLTGAAVSCSGSTGVMELRKGGLNGFYVTEKDNYRYTYGCAYTSTSLSLDYTKESLTDVDVQKVYVLYADSSGVNIGNLANFSISEKKVTFNNPAEFKDTLIAKGLSVGDIYATSISVQNSGVELYGSTPFIDFHFNKSNTDYTSRIIELERGKLNVNGAVFTDGGTIWGTGLSINGAGAFSSGLTSGNESRFWVGSGNYQDPYPGKSCTIKSWGTVASLRFAAKGIPNTWLGAAKPDGAAYDTINTDAGALVPGWRVRTADGAWVGASYAQDPGFRIYYCNASRLAGNSNGTDAVYTFSASGTFHAKSVSQTSDEREKNILSGITEKYEKLFMRLKPVLFNWKTGTDGIHMGFGAQTTLDLAEKCGLAENELAAVHKSKTEEPWSMSYTEIVPLAVQMTQKVTKKTVEQDQKIKILESHIQMLQTALDQAFVEIAKLKKAVG